MERPWPRARTVVVGDTPRDVACARADGLRVVAITTGPFARDDLQEADVVVDHAAGSSTSSEAGMMRAP